MKRLGWDEYFLEMAAVVARRSGCTRSQVGAILVDGENRVVSTGYNGTAVRGALECFEGGCPRGKLTYDELPAGGDYGNCTYRHAELNALLYAQNQNRLDGKTLYVTRNPCDDCVGDIIRYGAERVVSPNRAITMQDGFYVKST